MFCPELMGVLAEPTRCPIRQCRSGMKEHHDNEKRLYSLHRQSRHSSRLAAVG
jgi:hypothetical protein